MKVVVASPILKVYKRLLSKISHTIVPIHVLDGFVVKT